MAETKIDAAAAKNARGVLHGFKGRPWGPNLTRNRRVSGFTMPMQVSVFDFELNARNRLRQFLAFNSKSKTETCIVSMQGSNELNEKIDNLHCSNANWSCYKETG